MRQKINIPYVNLAAQYSLEKDELLKEIDFVLSSGQYVGGKIVQNLENQISKYVGVSDVVCLNSGTDALILSLKALGINPGDEVITQANSFISSTSVIKLIGATPVFADVTKDQLIDPDHIKTLITKKTKAIIPVHLTGRIAEMDKINRIAKKNNLFVIEDAAQSFGSVYKNKKSGSLADVAAFSAHPLKNFNACGDAGFITTNNKSLAKKIRLLSNHGLINRNKSTMWGTVSRLDTLQAAILLNRFKRFKKLIDSRIRNAKLYSKLLNKKYIYFAESRKDCIDTYHTFVIHVKKRDKLMNFLSKNGINTAIHYPIPIHLQPVGQELGYKKGSLPNTERQAKEILTLPVNQTLQKNSIEIISKFVNDFFEKNH